MMGKGIFRKPSLHIFQISMFQVEQNVDPPCWPGAPGLAWCPYRPERKLVRQFDRWKMLRPAGLVPLDTTFFPVVSGAF